MTWMSKGPSAKLGAQSNYYLRVERGSVQTAHFVEGGEPICSREKKADGVTPLLAAFKCGWVPLAPQDRSCAICRFALRRRALAARLAGMVAPR